MSVYLLDEKVVLVSDSVATDESCCCVKGACCVGADCTIETEGTCTSFGGTYQGDGTDCDPNPCEATGACCHDPLGDCTVESESDCMAAGGHYRGDGTNCDSEMCVGSCTDCFGCQYPRSPEFCADHGMSFCADTCEECFPMGCCCQYDEFGNFNSCAGTTESQCLVSCCDPTCEGWTLVWHPDIDDCIGCSGLTGCGPL